MMDQLIASFTSHLEEAIKIGAGTSFNTHNKPVQNVLICGLGGSGIGGTIISTLISDSCGVPITINKDYSIPEFVNENTLVICSSYSGNTEETLEMYQKAQNKGAEISIITSGGKFAELAEINKQNIIKIPGGLPPRAAFGLAFPQLFFTFYKYGLVDGTFQSEFENAIKSLNEKEEQIKVDAKSLANELLNKVPVIYCESKLEGAAVRLRQQINENSKMLCWHHVIPEMNHNELVGWRKSIENLAVVFLRSDSEYYRNEARIKNNQEVIRQYTNSIHEIHAFGESELEKTLYLIHFGDWVSYYLAELKGIDAVEVDVIGKLKDMLGQLG